jgi:hypothetical protein
LWVEWAWFSQILSFSLLQNERGEERVLTPWTRKKAGKMVGRGSVVTLSLRK